MTQVAGRVRGLSVYQERDRECFSLHLHEGKGRWGGNRWTGTRGEEVFARVCSHYVNHLVLQRKRGEGKWDKAREIKVQCSRGTAGAGEARLFFVAPPLFVSVLFKSSEQARWSNAGARHMGPQPRTHPQLLKTALEHPRQIRTFWIVLQTAPCKLREETPARIAEG